MSVSLSFSFSNGTIIKKSGYSLVVRFPLRTAALGHLHQREHLNESSPPLEIGVLRQKAGGRRQEERGRRKEEEGKRKKERGRRKEEEGRS
ncbi:hypothetical protein [Microcoleus sp. D3_18a_C4]|uniref:hypothetical protein n=1 Tax=Microcoleus sp. D3_18a_C4 TaxID=3055332 RepID=UPI002FD6C691